LQDCQRGQQHEQRKREQRQTRGPSHRHGAEYSTLEISVKR
jgi:hypothetical protein